MSRVMFVHSVTCNKYLYICSYVYDEFLNAKSKRYLSKRNLWDVLKMVVWNWGVHGGAGYGMKFVGDFKVK